MSEPTSRLRRRWRRSILLLLLVGAPLLLMMLAGRRPSVEAGTVLVVALEGDIEEGPPQDPLRQLGAALGQEPGTPSLHELRRALRRARDDRRIAGVLVEIRPLSCGWAVVEELRGLLGAVRAAGKPVQALLDGDFVEEKEYYLAIAASRIVLTPQAGLLLNGLLAQVSFYRGVLDWLQIEPEVLQLKEYKSAGEPLVNKAMSPAMREAMQSILTEIHERFLDDVAKERKIDPQKLRQIIDRGLLTSQEGTSAGLIDAVGYRDELEEVLGARDRRKRVDPHRYLKALGEEPRSGAVALIYASGPILAGTAQGGFGAAEVIEGPKVARILREAADDEQVKAIVLRVDSPGGSAVGSDLIWREIQRAQSKQKPVVVSMSNVAGSGGYWISMGAESIVAQPSTFTGSIGVVFTHFNVLPLWERLGGTIDVVKLGQNADLMSPFKKWTPDQRARIGAWMQQVYDDFVRRAAQGRHMTPEALEPLAHGRVWTGAQARERKLVDELGGLETALRIARERARLPPEGGEPVLFPRHRGLLGALSQVGSLAGRILGGRVDPQAVLRQLAREIGSDTPSLLAPTIDIR